jgi:hypothetical protein|tara:strand:+ start:58 stop:309 length:252 start_codon:yes stop_codon:yes gene_type:complete
MITIPDLIGFTGVALLIVTYAMLQLDKIDPKGFWYSFNNLIVAILVTVSLVYTPNLASLVIEFFWFLISVYGIIMYYKKTKTG